MSENNTNASRKLLIVGLFKQNLNSVQIQRELVRAGYNKISRYRIWMIWKASPDYTPKRHTIMFCNFCLANKINHEMFSLRRPVSDKTFYRICEECVKRLLPIQPVQQ